MPQSEKPYVSPDWWIQLRGDGEVAAAFYKAHLNYWRPKVVGLLETNDRVGRKPSSRQELAGMLNRDLGNFSRMLSGNQKKYSPQDFLAMGHIFGLTFGDLFPNDCDWLAEATRILCGPSVGRADAVCFAEYCLEAVQQGVVDSKLNPTLVERVARKHRLLPAEAEEKIWHVMNELSFHVPDELVARGTDE